MSRPKLWIIPTFAASTAPRPWSAATTALPWRIYRPGMVVGHSATGAMDKIDGPYYLFKPLQKLRNMLPQWLPLIGFEGGHINLVPVDFVAAALAHLAHVPGQDGRCFHLTDPKDRRVGEVLNLFAEAAHAPTMACQARAESAGSAAAMASSAASDSAGADATTHRSAAARAWHTEVGRRAAEPSDPL